MPGPKTKQDTIKEATKRVPASVSKLRKNPIQVLKDLQGRLKQMLQEIEETVNMDKSEQWYPGKEVDLVNEQLEEARWRH